MPKVTIDGKEHEVALDAVTFSDTEVPEGFISQTQHEATIKSRVARAERAARTKLTTDDEFVREILESKGIELRDDGSVKGSLKDIRQLEEQWKAKHAGPLQTQLEAATKTIGELRQSQLHADILRHADGVRPGLKDAFVREVAVRLSLDDESGKWGVKGDDAFKYTTDGKLMGAEHVISDMRTQMPDWFQSSKMQGSNLQGTDSAGKRTFTAEEITAMSEAEYEANRSAILGL